MALTKTLGGGGGSSLTLKDEGSTLTTGLTSLDVVGAGATASIVGTAGTLTIPADGRVQIGATQTLGSAQATINFPSIPGTYTHLEVEILARGAAAAASVSARIRFNGDTGNNYDYTRENRFGSAQGAAVAFLEFAAIAAASAPASVATFVRLTVPYYANTSWHHSAWCNTVTKESAVGGGQYMNNGGGAWRSTAAITSIDLILSSGNWDTGSVFKLFGIP